jgi:5'(3')-deoxyribonucleotidase
VLTFPYIKRIFIDLDDTLVDFMGEFIKLLYGPEKKITPELLTETDLRLRTDPSFIDKMWNLVVEAGPQWYANLPKLPWADQLLEAANKACPDVAILTSPGSREQATIAAFGKIQWSLNEFGKNTIILAKRKYMCASDGALLIDDNPYYLNSWGNYCGTPVHLKREWYDYGYTAEEIIEALLKYSNH